MEKPLPLKPKLPDGVMSTPNTFAYLTKLERAWLAGLIDGCGRVYNHRILKTANHERLISYRLVLRSYTHQESAVRRAAKLLDLPLQEYPGPRLRMQLGIPYDRVDDLMDVLKPHISEGKYNAYVRAKYLSELSAFKLGRETYEYGPGRPKKYYMGVDWLKIDQLLAQPDITDALAKMILKAQSDTQALIK